MLTQVFRRSFPELSFRVAGLCTLSVACVLLAATPGRAQDSVSPGLRPFHFSGYAEISVADKYIYHGYVAENQGGVIQPYAEVFGEFYSGGSFLKSASLKLSVFSSVQLHDSRYRRDDSVIQSWYEVQIEPGIELTFAQDFRVTASYRRFESPNGAFGSSDAVELTLAMDDRRILGTFALHPHVSWIQPFGSGAGSEEGSYFEVGIAPTFPLAHGERPITVTLPITSGFGQRRYYAGEHFGFFSAGLAVNLPIPFIPAGFGQWNIGPSATYYRLGRTAAVFTNNGDRNDSVLALTVSTLF